MSNILDELINSEEEILEELIKIDNQVCHTNFCLEDLHKKEQIEINLLGDTLFITEGEPNTTIAILDELIAQPNNTYYLFVNQRFLALNKWLTTRFIELTNIRIELITDINYNKFLKRNDLFIMPIGELALVEQVKEDFS